MANAVANKAAIRAGSLVSRRRRCDTGRRDAARVIRDTLLDAPEAGMAGTVAVYLSTGTEPGTTGLAYALFKRGTYVLAPVTRPDGDLDWASYEGPDELAVGAHGTPEPTAPPRGVDAIRGADLVVVPALAVDRSGMRLGRGGGFFDRALARVHQNVLTIAVVYDDELLPELPAEPHDRRVRAAVTPHRGLIRFR